MSIEADRRTQSAPANPLKRRGVLIGISAAGAAALAVKALPGTAPVPAVAVAAKAAVDPAGGYQLTDHVLRYYDTARS